MSRSPVRSIVVVTAGLSQPSSTRLLADRLTSAVTRRLAERDVETVVHVVELREIAHDLTNTLVAGFPTGGLARAAEAVAAADAVIAVTPIFRASYSGLFKTFFDVLEADALAGKPVLMAATAGTARHSLALEFAMRPLFAYLKAVVVPTAVFAASEDFGSSAAREDFGSSAAREDFGSSAGSDSLATRVDRAAGELSDLLVGGGQTESVDPFEEPTPFERLLAG